MNTSIGGEQWHFSVPGFADEALSALEAQTQENSRLRQQLAVTAPATLS